MTSNHGIATPALRRRVSQSRSLLVGIVLALSIGASLILSLAAGSPGPGGRLSMRINPNTAPAASLTRLPGVGLTRAQAIVAYRRRVGRETGRSAAFACPDDLEHIDGIGPKTVAGMADWLRFE